MKSKTSKNLKPVSLLLMALDIALFGLFTLLPYRIHSSVSGFIITSPTPFMPGCSNAGSINPNPLNQCIDWDAPASIHYIGLAGAAIFVGLGLLTLWYVRSHLTLRQIKTFAITHFIVAVLTIVGFTTAYTLIRNDSQARQLHAYTSAQAQMRYKEGYKALSACDKQPVSAEKQAACESQAAELMRPIRTSIGYGMLPAFVVLLGALYLVVPLLILYKFALSPQHIAGQKKTKLFQ